MIRLIKTFLLTIPVLAVLFAAYAAYYHFSPGVLAEEKAVLIQGGIRKIAVELEKEGIISDADIFTLVAITTGKNKQFKAGEYLFPAHISPSQVFEKLIRGDILRRRITIPEGFSTAEILELLNATPYLSGMVPQGIVEGSLLPETYEYVRGDSREKLISRMKKEMDDFLAKTWAERAPSLPLKNPYEALILASIIEKETGIASERPVIASVFINRLRLNMRLESDPTVTYGITLGREKLERQLLIADLKTPNPYNTYTIPALPPTPITNPGRDAISAALNPEQTSYLFFVASGNGGHVFATTYQEHLRNVSAYRSKKHQ